jgi:hypothetical protein
MRTIQAKAGKASGTFGQGTARRRLRMKSELLTGFGLLAT